MGILAWMYLDLDILPFPIGILVNLMIICKGDIARTSWNTDYFKVEAKYLFIIKNKNRLLMTDEKGMYELRWRLYLANTIQFKKNTYQNCQPNQTFIYLRR